MQLLKKIWNQWWLKEIVAAILLAVLIRAFVVEARVVPTPSMVPAVMPGDHLIAEKFVYKFTGLHRGDIIVFEPPFDMKNDPVARTMGLEDDYLKRVIGLPGDTVQVKKGNVYVNGQMLVEPYIEHPSHYDYGPVKVPQGNLFVLGDNRVDSYDSHAWGFLPEANVRSHAVFRFWPLNRIGLLK